MSHFDQLSILTPDLKERRILDVGAGKGEFLIECVKRGVDAKGLEYNSAYITEAKERAQEERVSIDIQEGAAERMPFDNESFDFLNFSEVIEHVEDPKKTLEEARRVLAPGGRAYISVPNRFGFKDQHYHLYFVNWLPRAWSECFIRLSGREKYDGGHAGLQKLADMHYYTYRTFTQLLTSLGFSYKDIRIEKLKRKLGVFSIFALIVYIPARYCILDAFHMLAIKE